MNDKRVYYFDAYSVVSDEYGMLRYDCSGGDGIHLQTHCYSDFLNTLYNFLDDTNVKEHIEKIEPTRITVHNVRRAESCALSAVYHKVAFI